MEKPVKIPFPQVNLKDPLLKELWSWLDDNVEPADTIDFLDDKGKWSCNQCGACCRDIAWVYPNLAKENGECQHLTSTGRCEIYETRPFWCQVSNFREEGDDVRIARACSWLRRKYPGSAADAAASASHGC